MLAVLLNCACLKQPAPCAHDVCCFGHVQFGLCLKMPLDKLSQDSFHIMLTMSTKNVAYFWLARYQGIMVFVEKVIMILQTIYISLVNASREIIHYVAGIKHDLSSSNQFTHPAAFHTTIKSTLDISITDSSKCSLYQRIFTVLVY